MFNLFINIGYKTKCIVFDNENNIVRSYVFDTCNCLNSIVGKVKGLDIHSITVCIPCKAKYDQSLFECFKKTVAAHEIKVVDKNIFYHNCIYVDYYNSVYSVCTTTCDGTNIVFAKESELNTVLHEELRISGCNSIIDCAVVENIDELRNRYLFVMKNKEIPEVPDQSVTDKKESRYVDETSTRFSSVKCRFKFLNLLTLILALTSSALYASNVYFSKDLVYVKSSLATKESEISDLTLKENKIRDYSNKKIKGSEFIADVYKVRFNGHLVGIKIDRKSNIVVVYTDKKQKNTIKKKFSSIKKLKEVKESKVMVSGKNMFKYVITYR